MDPVRTLESRYLPLLHEAAARLRQKHPTFTIDAGAGSVGGATTFQGHHVYLEAVRPGSANPEPNCVALEICVRDLPGTPTLCTLDVGWGGDGIEPSKGLDVLAAEVAFTPQALRLIDEALPRLEAHLDGCLRDWEAAYPPARGATAPAPDGPGPAGPLPAGREQAVGRPGGSGLPHRGGHVHRIEQVFLVLVFVVSLFFVWIAFAGTPEGFESMTLVGAIMAGSAMICWFIRGRQRRPPDEG